MHEGEIEIPIVTDLDAATVRKKLRGPTIYPIVALALATGMPAFC